jgi:hypothetical protein
MQRAWKRVKANKGAAGIDGLDITQTAEYLQWAWPELRKQLLAGSYRPQPVRRVGIPKGDGSERELGIPTVTDRLIQQALLPVLQPLIDPTFSEHSHGFRPGRRAQDAVLAAQRYADDCNVYVRSQKAGERVMALLRRCYDKLRLRVNESKSAVTSVFGRKFLGYALWQTKDGEVRRGLSSKALQAFKRRIRQLTRRNGGRSIEQVVEKLRSYLLGWKGYFRLAQTPRIWRSLDEWIRRRLRALQLKQWRRGETTHRELLRLGASPWVAESVAALSRRWWHNSRSAIHNVLTIAYFDRMGVPRLS